MKRLMFGILVAFGLVSVSFAYELTEMTKGEVEGVKKIVEELELLDKNELLGYQGKRTLKEGRLFLEFVEKVKQSKEKNVYMQWGMLWMMMTIKRGIVMVGMVIDGTTRDL